MNLTSPPEINSALQQLTDTLVDVSKGYSVMIERAEGDLKTEAKAFSDLHGQHLTELRAALAKSSAEPDLDGSVMQHVHKNVVRARDAVAGLDEDAMGALKRGEERVLDSYRDTLETLPRDHDIRPLLERQLSACTSRVEAIPTES